MASEKKTKLNFTLLNISGETLEILVDDKKITLGGDSHCVIEGYKVMISIVNYECELSGDVIMDWANECYVADKMYPIAGSDNYLIFRIYTADKKVSHITFRKAKFEGIVFEIKTCFLSKYI